jgi:hypothetical protein
VILTLRLVGVAGKTAVIAGVLNVSQQLGIFGGLFVHEKHQKHEKAFYLVVSPFYYDVCDKDLRGFKNLAGLATLSVITKLTVY